MRIHAATLKTFVAACSVLASVTAVPVSAEDTVGLGWRTYDESDPESADFVVDIIEAETGTDLSETARCQSGSRVKRASIIYSDAAGRDTFGFFSEVSYSWDCKRLTRIAQATRGEVYQPQYTFAGYVHRNVSPAGGKSATASAQARFGICQQLIGQTCVLERTPTIAWKVYANGQASAKTTP